MLLNKIPFKEKDPGSFTIPYVIGKVGIDKALADLGASISLMPYSMYARLELRKLKPTRMLLHMKEDHKIPIILGRPFLATAHAMIDLFNKKISFEVGNETLTFDIEKSMKFFTPEDDECLSVDLIDNVVSDLVKEIIPSNEAGLASNHDNWELIRPTLFSINTIEAEKKRPKLTELPSHLEYAFLKNNQEFPAVLAWKVADIKGIGPSFCTHKILMEDNFKPVVQRQWRLNPKVQDVVKAEIVKLLDSGLIYAILDSPWVSPIHVVPKKGAVLGQRIDKKFRPIYYASKTMNDAQEHYTTTEKELLAVVYAFDKFRSYLIMSKTDVYTDQSALKYLFSKQDVKPRLIRWLLLLQEFTIEIKDKKGTENLVADHLSKLENPDLETLNKEAIRDTFPDEYLMAVHVRETSEDPWYANYANFLVSKIIPHGLTYHLRKNFLSDVKHYIWDDPYLFKSCPDGIIRRCVFSKEIKEILAHCHTGPTRGHYGADITAKKIFESGFYWPTIFRDAARTAYKSPIRSTPFRIVYGKACHLPMQMEHKAYWALKYVNLDLDTARKCRYLQLNKLAELQSEAYEHSQAYKERTKQWHDAKIMDKEFHEGDEVLVFNSRLKLFSGKLKSRCFSLRRNRRNHNSYAITDIITVCVPWKPSRDFTRPLGTPSGLKSLLHMLNATVIPMKGKRGPAQLRDRRGIVVSARENVIVSLVVKYLDIRELSEHSLSWGKEGNTKTKEMDVVLDQISNFNNEMNIITEEVRMVQHKYENPMEGRISNLEETLNSFIKESLRRQKKNKNMVWEIKKNYDQT
ncbi:reverse transcriptase domain-containing protein [Tanacetum coccineum]